MENRGGVCDSVDTFLDKEITGRVFYNKIEVRKGRPRTTFIGQACRGVSL